MIDLVDIKNKWLGRDGCNVAVRHSTGVYSVFRDAGALSEGLLKAKKNEESRKKYNSWWRTIINILLRNK